MDRSAPLIDRFLPVIQQLFHRDGDRSASDHILAQSLQRDSALRLSSASLLHQVEALLSHSVYDADQNEVNPRLPL
ncbi:hypothetical protein D3C86_2077650 [compost metagenome]